MAKTGEREQQENGAGAATALGEPPAQTEETTEPGAPTATAPPEAGEARRGRGRPPKQAKPEIRFFDRLRNLSLGEWENYLVYLYRTAPRTDAKKGGASANYITKYGAAFDEETVKRECGSGGYKIHLNQIGGDGKSRTVEVYFFDILDPNFPPKIAPGEWLNDPANEKWAWAKAAYEQQGKTEQPAPTGGTSDMSGALHAVGEIIKVLKPGDGASADPISQINAIGALLDRQKPETPAPPPPLPDPITQFAALAAALKDLRPEAPPSGDSHNDLMIQLITQNVELTNKLTQMKSPAAPRSSLNETLETINKLKGLFPADSQNPWLAAITTIADKFGPAAEAYVEQRTMRPPGDAPAGQPPGGERAEAPGSPPAGDKNREAFMQHRAMVQQIAGPLLSHLQAGQPGEDFAIWFVDGYGYGFFNQLKTLGKEQIMLVIKSIPELWNQIQPMDQLFSKFLDQFLAWAPDEPPPAMPPGKTEEPTQ